MSEERPIEFQRVDEGVGKMRTWRLRSETWDDDTANSASYDATTADLIAALLAAPTEQRMAVLGAMPAPAATCPTCGSPRKAGRVHRRFECFDDWHGVSAPAATESPWCSCGHAWSDHVAGHGCAARLEDKSECECGKPPSAESPAEVTHEQARQWLKDVSAMVPTTTAYLLAYVSQCEARQQRAEREVAELHRLERSARRVLETMTHERDRLQARVAELEASKEQLRESRRLERVRATDAEITMTELQSERDALQERVAELEAQLKEEEAVVQNYRNHFGTDTRPLTPADVRTIARAIIAEVALAASEATHELLTKPHPLAALAAEAAKEESGG